MHTGQIPKHALSEVLHRMKINYINSLARRPCFLLLSSAGLRGRRLPPPETFARKAAPKAVALLRISARVNKEPDKPIVILPARQLNWCHTVLRRRVCRRATLKQQKSDNLSPSSCGEVERRAAPLCLLCRGRHTGVEEELRAAHVTFTRRPA